jgi:TPR repeat protein
MNSDKTLARIAWIVCLATGVVISVKQIREPDIWWILKTGEWICKNHQVPMADMFSYTFEGTPWINVKWGFEVLLYGISILGGPEFTPVLQCIVTVGLLLILLNNFSFLKNVVLKTPVTYPTYGIIIASFIFLFVNEFRLNGRPEMTSHLMTALYLNILLKARFKNPKLVYWIIPLQVIWTNFHEAYGTGMIIMFISACVVWSENYFFRKYKTGFEASADVRKNFSLAALLTLFAPALHPQGLKMIYHPVEIFRQVSANQFTTELVSFSDADYWHYQAYISTGLFLIGMIYFFSNYKNAKKKFQSNIFQSLFVFGLFYFILFLLFFYLSLTAFRNIPFFVIISTPVIAVAIEKFFSGIKKSSFSPKLIYVLLIVFGLFSYGFVATNHYYKTFNPRDVFGMKIDPDKNPVGTAKFLRDHKITGTGFSDYLTSSYLLWSLYPDFKTFIDLRDLDIFPESFFKSYLLISSIPQYFDSADAKVHFEYAVVYRLQFQPLHQHLIESGNWDLVYTDAVAALYLKKNEKNKALINQFGFLQNNKDVFVVPGKPQPSAIANTLCKILWFPYDPDKNEKIDYDLIASQFYQMIHQNNFAINRAQKSSTNHIDDSQGFAVIGNIYLNASLADSTDSLKNLHLEQSQSYFNEALLKNKNSAASFLGLGMISIMTNNIGTAKTYLKKCVDIDPDIKDAYLKLAECETILSKQYPQGAKKNLEQWIQYMEKAVNLDKENIEINFRLGMGYCTNGDKSKAKKYLRKAIESNQLDKESLAAAENCLN